MIEEHGLRPIAEARADLQRAQQHLQRQREEAQRAFDRDSARAQRELEKVQKRRSELENEADQLRRVVTDLRATAALQDVGLFDYEHPAETSAALAAQLEVLRNEIKSIVRAGQATRASQSFTFNNSASKGRSFVNNMSKILLRAYNAEAENCVSMMKAGRLDAAQKRLARCADQIAKQGTMINLQITSQYQNLRMQELQLADRHLQAKQQEKEAERERREELREQRKAERELAAEQAKLTKERDHYLATLAALEGQGDEEGAARMRERLADVDRAIEDVDYRAANIRAGYVYVISNIGSFGPDVVKIGMTRRLEPMDRVRELGDASVPFRFDVHALFFADDAVGVETMLHQHFEEVRVNKVNRRREYFRTTPDAVLQVLKERNVEVLEFAHTPEATEYHQTLAMEA